MKTLKTFLLLLVFLCTMYTVAAAQLVDGGNGTPEAVYFGSNVKNVFKDVTENDWFYSDVCYVYENKIMSGTEATVFLPNEKVTRAMIITILYRMAGEPDSPENVFSDVEKGAWYEKAVAWGAANKITSGTGKGTFSPTLAISREGLAQLLYNYSAESLDKVDLSNFTDANAVSQWAQKGMAWAVKNKIINGKSETELAPADNATRAEAAAIIKRFITMRGTKK